MVKFIRTSPQAEGGGRKEYTDPEQASWKSKGLWDKNQPDNLTNSFAFYCPQSGYYWVFISSEQIPLTVVNPATGPLNLNSPNAAAAPTTGPANLTATELL